MIRVLVEVLMVRFIHDDMLYLSIQSGSLLFEQVFTCKVWPGLKPVHE